MNTEDITEHHGCEVRPVVTPTTTGRYAAAAVVTDRVGDTRTLAVEGDLSNAQDACDEALELAVAWIQQRSVISERYVRRVS